MPAPKDAELAVRTTVQRELHPGRHELSQRQQYRLLDGMEKIGCSQALTRTRTPSPWP
jgi:hypothetical protein